VYGVSRIQILPPGAENDDRNPPRATPRHIFNFGVGTGNLFPAERFETVLRFTVLNMANEAALYNFLSPFSGTHWVGPRVSASFFADRTRPVSAFPFLEKKFCQYWDLRWLPG
jgi:hypothetical protein